jgi:hypothetical protein
MLFSVEMIDASEPSVTCAIRRVSALRPAPHPVNETASDAIANAESVRRIGAIVSHQISSE